MNKKILVLLVSFLIFLINSYSSPINAKFGIGLKGAYTIIAPTDFNDDFTNVIYYGYKDGASNPSTLKTMIGS